MKTLSLFVSALLSTGLCLPVASANTNTLTVVEYYAGKDEVCMEGTSAEVGGQLKQIIEVTDVYGPGDGETYCTIVLGSKHSPDLRRFSASPARCRQVKERIGAEDLIMDVVGDHICGI